MIMQGPPGSVNKDGRLVATSHEKKKDFKGSFSICPFAILALLAFPLESAVEVVPDGIAELGVQADWPRQRLSFCLWRTL